MFQRDVHSESSHGASPTSYCCQLTVNYFGAAKQSFETVAHGKVQDCKEEAPAQKGELGRAQKVAGLETCKQPPCPKQDQLASFPISTSTPSLTKVPRSHQIALVLHCS